MSDLTGYLDGKPISARKATPADIPELVEIINDAYSYQDEAKGKSRTDPEHLKARFDETDFYVFEKDGKIIGCVYLEPRESSLHFGLLTLIPSFRKKGIGELIVGAIQAYAEKEGFKLLELDYMSLAPWLRKYYEKYGFEETGEVAAWGTINLIRMRKEIK
jgi:N-acetylglutamate synthase-like GNAT family acetyltransferase